VAGIWGLAVFLLENYYTVLLISYVAAPNPQPMIKTIYELRNRPDLRLVTDKNVNLDLILLVISIYQVYTSQNCNIKFIQKYVQSAESGFYKDLGDRLRADPESRCVKTKECVEMTKAGNTVYASVYY